MKGTNYVRMKAQSIQITPIVPDVHCCAAWLTRLGSPSTLSSQTRLHTNI